jgi:hypothetical protein
MTKRKERKEEDAKLAKIQILGELCAHTLCPLRLNPSSLLLFLESSEDS